MEQGFGHGGWGFQSCSHTTLLKRNGSPGSRPGSPEFAAVRDRTAAIAPYAGALPRVMAKVTADPQSSVSEYSYLASLQNTLTEGPRGFSDVIGVSKERTEKIDNFHKCPRHTGP